MKLLLHNAMNFTELAITDGLQTVTPEVSQTFFQHCGFNI